MRSASLPLVSPRPTWPSLDVSALLTDLQARGMRFSGRSGLHRVGGAGPSDHKAVSLLGETVMVPLRTLSATVSPFEAVAEGEDRAMLYRDGAFVAELSLPQTPRFYALSTADGIPYWKIATLHSRDVLATTVLQSCVRYGHRETSCQFCAIGQSLRAQRTIARKTPAQLAEVAVAAAALDGVSHVVLTTGTPNTSDRGAAILRDSSAAIHEAVGLPIQAQCEPPDRFVWFERLAAAGVRSLGMHLEAVTEPVRKRVMPGKAQVPVSAYLEAFDAAVEVFGRGQVTSYLLAGLGDSEAAIIECVEDLVRRGVYPFVVPLVPIAGTPLERHPPPDPAWLQALLDRVAKAIARGGLSSQEIAAGCGRCGACSTLRSREGGGP